jgi:release factor glutamine methyltransferase
LAQALPTAAVFASDVSPEALCVARSNAERLGLPVTFIEGSLAEPLVPHAPFDCLVANLPYVASGDMATLSREVLCEPRLALDGGADGLALVRALVAAAPEVLVPGGTLILEVGEGQAGAASRLCEGTGFEAVRTRRDLAGIERVVAARWPRSPGGGA